MRVAVTLLILTPALFAQAIVEHAVAAAVGSAAGVAGKRVSESLDKALAVVNKTATKTAEPEPVEAPGPKVT